MSRLYITIVERISGTAYRVAQACILLAILICCGNAVSRKVLDLSSNAFLEIQWYLFGSAFLLAGAKTLADNAHIRIDVLAARLSTKNRHIVDLLGLILCVLPFCIMMLHDSWPMVSDAWLRGERSADAGGLLRWPIKAMIPAGFGILALQVTAEILKTLTALRAVGSDTGTH